MPFLCCLFTMLAAQEKTNEAQQPEGPATEFVMQLRVTLDAPYTVGETPHGRRTVIPITGGTFEGPLLKGTILSGGADWQLAKGNRTEVEAIYSIKIKSRRIKCRFEIIKAFGYNTKCSMEKVKFSIHELTCSAYIVLGVLTTTI